MTDVTGLVAALADLPNIYPTEGRAMRRPGRCGGHSAGRIQPVADDRVDRSRGRMR